MGSHILGGRGENILASRDFGYFINIGICSTNMRAGRAGSGVWTRGSMIAREKKFGRVRLSTNAWKINMADVPSIVVIENLSWSSSVNRLLLVFTCFGEFGSTLGGTADVLDGIKTLSRGEFNRRKHMFTFDGELIC